MDPAQEFLKEIALQHRAASSGTGVNSLVRRAYEGRTVFVTGGNGFLGKHLLEKLIRACNIEKAYLLMRPKKGKSVQERLDLLTKDVVFEELRNTDPGFSQKLVPVEGDAKELRLSLSTDDWATITRKTEIIIHAAATINFEDALREATLVNVRGTREVISLAQQCPKLRSLVHVSTAYSHATKDRIGKDVLDQFYPSPVDPDLLIDMAEMMDEGLLNSITPQLLQNKWPNTYTFTKACGEELIKRAKQIPASIVRPAIIICAYREPTPGWLDSSHINGASGLVLGGSLGILHVMNASRSAHVDLVPVDFVNNAIIAAGWAAIEKMDGEAKVYTVATARHPMLIAETHTIVYGEVKSKYSSPKAVWYASITVVKNKYLYQCLVFLFHYVPGYVLDVFRLCLLKPPYFLKLYTKAEKLSSIFSYFLTNEWKFGDQNTLVLYKTMSKEDRILFNFDVANIDWKQQTILWSLGQRKYLVKDGLVDSKVGSRRQFWFRFLHYIVATKYLYILWKILIKFRSVASMDLNPMCMIY